MTDQEKKERYAKVKATMLKKYGPDFYSTIGRKGGKNSTSRPYRDNKLAKESVNKRWHSTEKK